MAAITFVTSILPGKQEEWRRFCQSLMGSRQSQFEASRRELGITRELVWLARLPQADMAVIYYEVEQRDRLLQRLAEPLSAFDCWLRDQLQQFHGPGWTGPTALEPNELILEYLNTNMKEEEGETSMSTVENKRIARQFLAEVDSQNYERAWELLAPGFLAHPPGAPQPLNAEMFKQLITSFDAGFPGYSHTVEDQVAEGDRVVCRVTFQGTHTGNFQGMLPTGKTVNIWEIHVMRLQDGKIAEYWAEFDTMGMLQQLGVIPAAASAV